MRRPSPIAFREETAALTLIAAGAGLWTIGQALWAAGEGRPAADAILLAAAMQPCLIGGALAAAGWGFLFFRPGGAMPAGGRWLRGAARVAVPLAVWGCIAAGVAAFAGGGTPSAAGWAAAALFGEAGHPLPAALLQLLLVCPLLRSLGTGASHGLLAAAALISALAWVAGLPGRWAAALGAAAWWPDGALAGALLLWLPAMGFGALLAAEPELFQHLAPRPRWIFALGLELLTASACVAAAQRWADGGGAPVYAGAVRPAILIGSLLWLPFAARWAWAAAGGPAAAFLREAGRRSLALLLISPALAPPLSLAGSSLPTAAAVAVVLGGMVVGASALIWIAGGNAAGRLLSGRRVVFPRATDDGGEAPVEREAPARRRAAGG